MELEKKVIKIIADSLEVNEDQLTQDTSIGDFPEWNSLGHMVIISTLEREFSINFDAEIIMDLEDVSDIVDAIEKRLTNN